VSAQRRTGRIEHRPRLVLPPDWRDVTAEGAAVPVMETAE
jgi:hypothetical protein